MLSRIVSVNECPLSAFISTVLVYTILLFMIVFSLCIHINVFILLFLFFNSILKNVYIQFTLQSICHVCLHCLPEIPFDKNVLIFNPG